MKTVAVIYSESSNFAAIEHNQSTLEEIFSQEIEVINYYYDQFTENTVLEADAYLLSNDGLLSQMRSHISNFKNVIIMERGLQKQGIPAILEIPVSSDVLVVNDTVDSSLHTVYLLYSLGITHINLIPYDMALDSSGIYRNIQYAVTPNEGWLVPPYINRVVNCLYRIISFRTLLKLAQILGLDSDIINRNLIQHLHLLAETDADYHNNYLDSYLKSQTLNQVIRDADEAIIVVNSEYKPVYTNKEAADLLHLNGSNPLPPSIVDILQKSTDNSLIELYGDHLVLEKKTLMLMDQLMGYSITLRNEKNLQKIESNLNSHLRQRGLYAKYQFQDIIQSSAVMSESIRIAKKASVTDFTVLIRGESGSGKELFAQSIHNYSHRNAGPFVAINCASFPESLLESQLFGYEEGAFTGARKGGKAGLFELANKGTIFLDEIGDISPALQSRLLRVLQEKQIMRIGSDKIINIDVRIIAATNRNLEKLINEGKFRQDLFYRLSVIPVEVQPLRKRKEDILPLLSHFLGSTFNTLTSAERTAVLRHDWPGNVRELENAATYYKALGSFPDFTVFNSPDTPKMYSESTSNVSYHKPNIEMQILELLADAKFNYQGLGREAILSRLHTMGYHLSSGKLRTILSTMHDKQLISISRGRSGCSITDTGLSLLQNHF